MKQNRKTLISQRIFDPNENYEGSLFIYEEEGTFTYEILLVKGASWNYVEGTDKSLLDLLFKVDKIKKRWKITTCLQNI